MTEVVYSNALIANGGVDALSPIDPTHMARHGLFSVLGRYGSALCHTVVPIATTAAAAADRAGSVCVCLREKSRLALRWESTRLAREQRGDARISRWRTCRARAEPRLRACARDGGSPVPCLQPCVHPQPSVRGEYDGKFTRPLFQLTQQPPAQVTDSIVRPRLPARRSGCRAL